MKSEERLYKFYIIKSDGSETTWARLTKTKAVQMYRYTEQSTPDDVKSYGWGLME